MLTRIEAFRYRSLRRVEQPLSRFHALVGANGSGKSTFLDCAAFLSDMVQRGPLKACQGNGDAPPRAARGADLVWMRSERRFEIALEFEIPLERRAALVDGPFDRVRYEVQIDTGDESTPLGITIENLVLVPADYSRPAERQRQMFPEAVDDSNGVAKRNLPKGWRSVLKRVDGGNDYFAAETSNWKSPFKLGGARSLLANLPEDEEKFPVATWVRRMLVDGVQRIALDSSKLRRSSPPGSSHVFLPDGSNLPWVIHALEQYAPRRHADWVAHVRTALPDLVNVTTVEREDDRHRYLRLEYSSGLQAPSWLASDGTLRLLALTLLAYVPDQRGIFLIEEPENGIHPQAIETALQSLSSIYDGQVLCASHSPVVLGLLRPEQVLCFARDSNGATDVVEGSHHPILRDWQGALDLSTVFASGVLG